MTIRMRRIFSIMIFAGMIIGLLCAVSHYVRMAENAVVQEVVQGPQPVVTEQAFAHMTERHFRLDVYPEKSKFIADTDLRALVDETYAKAFQILRGDHGKYIYDYNANRSIGTEGQQVVRLVTAVDGRVITMYPMHGRQGHRKAA